MKNMLRNCGLALALTLGCGPAIEVEEPKYEPDVERICAERCANHVGCGEPGYSTQNECNAFCVDYFAWELPCNEEYEAEQECEAALSCEDLALLSTDSPLPREEQPCWEKSLEFNNCHVENPPEDWEGLSGG